MTPLFWLQIIGVLDYGLAKIADSMIKHVINPTVINGSVDIFIEEPDEASVEKCEAVLKLLPSSERQVYYFHHMSLPYIQLFLFLPKKY